ncbi:TetR/AcrR family transcriptional regulator [Tomitella gaofuii]|uniref:TetR/AcrR family transcriptional regulator n=1 Tax=Tomitella gaofuii TaxID=2760083 RepID=UPI0015FAD6A0|nr:TetR/AcrR family transcriptional regulator [Tomitella gaofuii]
MNDDTDRPSVTRRTHPHTGRPRSESSRKAILDSTLAMLAEHPPSGITIASIALEAGVGKSTIYRWWSSRTALILDAIEELPKLEDPDTGRFADDLHGLLVQLTEVLANSPLGKVLAHFAADSSARRDPVVRDYIGGRLEPVTAVIGRAVVRGELPASTDVEALVYLALGPVVNRAFFGPDVPTAQFIDCVVATVVRGYGSDGGRHGAG